MTSIYLHGELSNEFGNKFELEVNSVAEAISAIEANTGKFIVFLQSKIQDYVGYHVIVDDSDIGEEDIICKTPQKEIHITPVIEGGKSGAFKIIAGLALIAAPYLAATAAGGLGAGFTGTALGGAAGSSTIGALYGSLNFFGNMAVSLGLSLVMGGITELMTKQPKMGEAKSTQSYLFEGNQNNQAQGQPVPIGYGRLRVGSQLVGQMQKNSLLTDNSFEKTQERRQKQWEEVVNDTFTRLSESYRDFKAQRPSNGRNRDSTTLYEYALDKNKGFYGSATELDKLVISQATVRKGRFPYYFELSEGLAIGNKPAQF